MLPRERRISKTRDWERLHLYGRTFSAPPLILKIMKNNLPRSRFGFIVGTKVSKKAAPRNKIKRQLRASMSRSLRRLKEGYDIMIITKPGALEKKFHELEITVRTLLHRAGALR